MDMDQVGTVISVKKRNRMYEHYGILDGKNGVIHVNKRLGLITIDPLEKVIARAQRVTYMNDDFETRWRNYTNASRLVGSTHQYRFLTDNCETWINKIRTGAAFSTQVDQFSKSLAAVLIGGVCLFSLGNTIRDTTENTDITNE